MSDKREFKVCSAYDTETTNFGEGSDTRAFPILYIFNDLRNIKIDEYKVGRDSDIKFFRYTDEAIEYIDGLIQYGQDENCIPIICAYNLMFDMQSLMFELSEKYDMKVNAQSSTSAYTLDLMRGKTRLLRFWDTFYLEQGGLKAMGETCGIPKAVGDWDYSLLRTPETELTDLEKFYAGRDTEVIPAYLKYLCDANEWLKPKDLGCRVITKTSVVRQMAYHQIGSLKYINSHNSRITLLQAFETTCKQELPKTFDQYALRKSCFRGGLTFTSANFASRVMHNVVSLDVTSMHHTFINGAKIPVHFRKIIPSVLNRWCNEISLFDMNYVMNHYDKPFNEAFHARIYFYNLRMKKNSAFKDFGIAIIPEGKFKDHVGETDYSNNEANKFSEDSLRLKGWKDKAWKPLFAYGKLMSAEKVVLHINEIEFWNICQVYDFDSFNVVLGEGTEKFTRPPDYVTLQSNKLFEMKTDAKKINNTYIEGEKYKDDIPKSIPESIAKDLKSGKMSSVFFNGWYNSTIKGMFNGIYGTMAQDIFKPDFIVDHGNIKVDLKSETTNDNFSEKIPDKCKVLYTYGMRIVGRSRMHLIIALMLLYDNFKNKVIPTGGDTDSIKAACSEDISDNDLKNALYPIEKAADYAINSTMKRVRKVYPKIASKLTNIGHFDIEKADGKDTRWQNHFEGWNKARISESNGHVHVTCAGLSRPQNLYHIENACDDLLKAGYTFEQIAPNVLGFEVFVDNSISHSLQKYKPEITDKYNGEFVDYKGNKTLVNTYEAIALYPTGRWLGETTKRAIADNLYYLRNILHRKDIDVRQKTIVIDGDKIKIIRMDENGDNVICEAKISKM